MSLQQFFFIKMILPVEILEVIGKHLEHEEYKNFKKTSIYNNLPFEQFVSFETYSKVYDRKFK